MKTGKHVAAIKEIELREEKAVVSFENQFGETIQAGIFYQDFKKTDTSFLLKQLIAATAEDVTEMWELKDNTKALPTLIGRSVLLTIENSEGLQLRNTSKGYTAGEYTANTVKELLQKLTDNGLRLQHPIVTGIDSGTMTTTTARPKRTHKGTRLEF